MINLRERMVPGRDQLVASSATQTNCSYEIQDLARMGIYYQGSEQQRRGYVG